MYLGPNSMATMIKKKKMCARRRALRNRAKQHQRAHKLRVSVFRSAKHIYAQLIDDLAGKTLFSFSSHQCAGVQGDKKAVAHHVGMQLAKHMQDEKLHERGVFFDRGQYVYHGRVAALANGLREGGLSL